MSPPPGSGQPPRVDLHLHSTASDGRLTPAELVAAVAAAGVTTMAVTDHDTVAAAPEVAALCRAAGIEFVPGIEITAVENGRDVHVLGYFVEVVPSAGPKAAAGGATDGPTGSQGAHTGFETFLMAQREVRLRRVEEIVRRLAGLGMPLDLASLLDGGQAGRSVGRPMLARALVASGYAGSIAEAFDRWLAAGRPAFVPRTGAPVAQVIDTIHRAGGLASLAHPGRTGLDDRLEEFCAAGLDAIEAFHSDHDAATAGRYWRRAKELGVLVTGGSDFHGEPGHGLAPGSTTLPADEWERLSEARRRHARA